MLNQSQRAAGAPPVQAAVVFRAGAGSLAGWDAAALDLAEPALALLGAPPAARAATQAALLRAWWATPARSGDLYA